MCKKGLGSGILPESGKNSKEEGTAVGKANTRYADASTVEYEHLEAWVKMLVRGFVQVFSEEEVEVLLGWTKSERRKAVDAPIAPLD